jgi:hypothetical protein
MSKSGDIMERECFTFFEKVRSAPRDPGAAHQRTGAERINGNLINRQVYEFLRKLDDHGVDTATNCLFERCTQPK